MEIATILAGILLIGGALLIDQAQGVKAALRPVPVKNPTKKKKEAERS